MNKSICKTKKQFMNQLRNALLWKYNINEITDIINDYEEYFSVGLDKGKTEKELCTEFGSAKVIVQNLDIEFNQGKQLKNIFTLKFIARSIMTIVLCGFTIIFIVDSFNNANIFSDIIVAMVLFIPLLWFVLGGGALSGAPILYQESPKNKKSIVLLHSVIAIITCGLFLFMKDMDWILIIENGLFNMKAADIGPLVMAIIKFFITIVIIVFVYSLHVFYSYPLKYFMVICHSVGSICSILCLISVLRWGLNDTYQFLIFKSIIPYAFSIIMLLLLQIYFRLINRGGNKYGCSNEKRDS